jgi:hypothetical protein
MKRLNAVGSEWKLHEKQDTKSDIMAKEIKMFHFTIGYVK